MSYNIIRSVILAKDSPRVYSTPVTLIVSKGIYQQVVVVSLCRGNLWKNIKFLHLRYNMYLDHSEANNQYAQWLLEIGTGSTIDNNKMIQVSQSMVCANFNTLINRIYSGIGNPRVQDDQYFLDYIIY